VPERTAGRGRGGRGRGAAAAGGDAAGGGDTTAGGDAPAAGRGAAAAGRGAGGRGAAGAAASGDAAAAGFTPPPPLAVIWTKFRGPGDVKFDKERPSIDRAADGKSTVNATFSAPGDYILRIEGNDTTGQGGGGFQCCWSNAHIGVSIK
jgi:hypothetical protein